MTTLNLELTEKELISLHIAIEYRMIEVRSKIETFRREKDSLKGQLRGRTLADLEDYYVECLRVYDSLLQKVYNY